MPARSGYLAEVIVAYLLLAAPVVAALLFWGAWGWVAVAVVVAAVEYAALQRSQRFSARFWRSVGVAQRSRRERGVELVYVVSAAFGVIILIGSLLDLADRRPKAVEARRSCDRHRHRGVLRGSGVP